MFDEHGDAGSHGDMVSVDAIGGDGVERGMPPLPLTPWKILPLGCLTRLAMLVVMVTWFLLMLLVVMVWNVALVMIMIHDEPAAGPSSAAHDDGDAIVGVVGIEAGDTDRDGDSSDDHAAGRHGDSSDDHVAGRHGDGSDDHVAGRHGDGSDDHVAGRHGDPGLEEDVSDATSVLTC